jgi:hypothetical protein
MTTSRKPRHPASAPGGISVDAPSGERYPICTRGGGVTPTRFALRATNFGSATGKIWSAPGRTRTCDPRLRRPPLYPAELPGRGRARVDGAPRRGGSWPAGSGACGGWRLASNPRAKGATRLVGPRGRGALRPDIGRKAPRDPTAAGAAGGDVAAMHAGGDAAWWRRTDRAAASALRPDVAARLAAPAHEADDEADAETEPGADEDACEDRHVASVSVWCARTGRSSAW